jgi:hypothetical protein
MSQPKDSYHISNKIKKPKKKGGQGPAWAIKATDCDKDECIAQLQAFCPCAVLERYIVIQ